MKYFCVRLFQNFHQVTQAVQCCRGWLHSRPSFHLRLQLYLDNQQQICWNCQFWKDIESMLELSEQTGENKIKQEPLIHRDHQSPLSKTAQTFGPGSMCKTTWIRCSIFNRHAQCLNDFPFVICKWRIPLKKNGLPWSPSMFQSLMGMNSLDVFLRRPVLFMIIFMIRYNSNSKWGKPPKGVFIWEKVQNVGWLGSKSQKLLVKFIFFGKFTFGVPNLWVGWVTHRGWVHKFRTLSQIKTFFWWLP